MSIEGGCRAVRAVLGDPGRVAAAAPATGRGADVALPPLAASADRHPGTNGWIGSWGTNAHGEIAGCPPRTAG